MVTQKMGLSLLELLYKKPGSNFREMVETRDISEAPVYDGLDDFQRTQLQWFERVTTLQARNKELEAYAHMVAHDLKDPLTVMIAASDLITFIPDLPRNELKEYLQQIRTTAYEMNRIIESLLFFAEVSKGEVPMGPVKMAEVVENVRDRLKFMIREHQAVVQFPSDWPKAIGYGPWIEEVWANYLSNAIKYGVQPPRVELGASSETNDVVRFWARDNGPGIAPEVRARIFTPFSQIDRAPSRGHGLGLSIVLHIVEKLGGEVGVESEVGKGSLFYFTLPADVSLTQ
jgi:two-component system, sensor histidine kinase and response regulator